VSKEKLDLLNEIVANDIARRELDKEEDGKIRHETANTSFPDTRHKKKD